MKKNLYKYMSVSINKCNDSPFKIYFNYIVSSLKMKTKLIVIIYYRVKNKNNSNYSFIQKKKIEENFN